MSYRKLKFKYLEIILSLSKAIELTSPKMLNHLKKVAFISYSIAKTSGIQDKTILKDIFTAGLLHDIGVLYIDENDISGIFDCENYIGRDKHAEIGATIVKPHGYFGNISELIENHHRKIKQPGDSEPNTLEIISLSDRISNLIKDSQNTIQLKQYVMDHLDNWPESIFLSAFKYLSKIESFWLSLRDDCINKAINKCFIELSAQDLDYEEIKSFSFFIARLIDFRSPFTYSHSFNVAFTAQYLAEQLKFSDIECDLMFISGLLHDIGKLAVPSFILNKKGSLLNSEREVVNSHTFYTYEILSEIENIHPIEEWAAYHHEKLDGSGYPFHLKEDELSLGSRIMCVADIFAALSEVRPYKRAFENEEIIKILNNMAANNKLDTRVVEIAINSINHIRRKLLASVKDKAKLEYKYFLDTMNLIK